MAEVSKEVQDKALEIVEVAKSTGKIKKGINEVTKILERGNAKFVVYAEDVNPKEITMHLPLLAKEKEVPCVAIPTKDDLGAAAGLAVGTAAVVVVTEGNSKDIIAEVKKQL
ncbi:MAG: ribosomal L7Ae/L30e/S12e/Gadd45 family protein [Candidatus Woesearchaeota archaeon]